MERDAPVPCTGVPNVFVANVLKTILAHHGEFPLVVDVWVCRSFGFGPPKMGFLCSF